VRLAVLALAGCFVESPAPIANVARSQPPVPYAAMVTALCGRLEQAWDDAVPELGGFRLVPANPSDDSQRAWKLVGAPAFRSLREIRSSNNVVRAELEVDRVRVARICDALGSDDRVELRSTPPEQCRWQDTSTHVVEVIVRGGHPWMVCTM
jgi:hypothetical protein